jgi:serine/threonine-protein kinase
MPELCPVCGVALPPQAAAGLCPGCLLKGGLDGSAPRLTGAREPRAATGWSTGQNGAGALATLAATVGPLPRVLLRDTDVDAGPEPPLVRPASTELPDPADRPMRLQLLGEIARGGMGVILKGRDTELGRDLAVKVLLEAHRDRPEMVHRFIEEAQIGGQLQHPGIVPVYELGAFADRRPYFAMKLVKGRTLADLLAARTDPAQDRPRLLATFLAVAQTVAYAHARGVIHRDLKPSNVMVGSFGEVQVMDWGLAKVLPRGGIVADAEAGEAPVHETLIATVRSDGDSDADRSQAGSVMGTPAYMAPEQARGEVARVDERADVFALGSILCEVLTGQPAFTGRSAAAIQRQAARGDLAGALARIDACAVDAELRALVRDCLAAEPEDRPRDARAVAEWVSGYLASLQERMRQAELARAAEAARADAERHRRKLALALAASVLALLTLGGGASWWVVQDRRDRAARFDLALREAEVLRDQAAADPEGDVARWREARRALKDVADRLGRGAALPAPALGRLAALQRQVEQGEAAAKADRRLVARLEEIRGTLDLDEKADGAFSAAFAAAGLDPEHLATEEFVRRLSARPMGVARAAAEALDAWFLIRTSQGREPRAPGKRITGQELIDAARSIDPDPWRRGLREALARGDMEACRKLADDPACPAQGPAIQWLLALGLDILGDHARAIETLGAAAQRYPDDYWINTGLGTALLGTRRFGPGAGDSERILGYTDPWGPTRAERDQGNRAEPYLRAAVALRPHFGPARLNLAMAEADQGRFVEALAVIREGLRLMPGDPRLLYETGFILLRHDKTNEAVAVHRELVRLHPDSPLAHVALGWTLWAQEAYHATTRSAGRWDAATAELREALRLWPDNDQAHLLLGTVLGARGRLDGAMSEVRQVLRVHPDSAVAHAILGLILLNKGTIDEAIAECREAIRLSPKNWQPHWQPHMTLGDALQTQGKLDEAIAEWHEASRLHPENPLPHKRLGAVLKAKGDVEGALAEYHEAATRVRDTYSIQRIREAFDELGLALLARRDLDGAIAAFRDEFWLGRDREALIRLIETLKAKNNPVVGIALFDTLIRDQPLEPVFFLARVRYLVDLERFDRAEADLAQALRVWPKHPSVWMERARFEVARGHLDEAARAYSQALALHPTPVAPWRDEDTAGVFAEAAANPEILERLLRLQPGNRALRIGRVRYLAGRREWTKAADVLTQLNALEPPDNLSMLLEAHLRSWMGDSAGYRRVCRGMLERFGSTRGVHVARGTLLCCLLEGDAISDRRMLLRLLERLRGDPAARAERWSRIAEALYEYREGRFVAALEILGPASEARASSALETVTRALGCVIRAMAHARLGQADEARRQFAMAEAMRNQTPFDPSGAGPLPSNWWDWLRYHTLRREVEALLRDVASPADPSAPGRRP